MSGARKKRVPRPSPVEQHAEWLGLLAPDGPFLAAEVLTEAFNAGLPDLAADRRDRIRQGWSEVQGAPDLLADRWIELIIGELLGWKDGYRAAPDRSGPAPRPDFTLTGPGHRGGREDRLLFYRLPWGTDPAASTREGPSPVEAAAARCREAEVPLALVTDGRFWALVHARPAEPTSVGVYDADLWLEEPLLLRSFTALLAGRQVQVPPVGRNGEAPSDSTASLFARSADRQSELTDELGLQVRRAVELLVAELARLDRESRGAVLAHVGERDVYRGALTVLMRMVFLLYAEEQRLLPTDDLYAEHYSVGRLHDRLAEDRTRHGEEVADRRAAAWPRLLALFNGIHGGAEHPDLRLPAYGGALFSPEAFPWLEAFQVSDRVVFQILDALVMLAPKRKNGTPTRISYKGLGVEDIGHIYEGLLEFSCLKVEEAYVGLKGKREPELPLAALEERASAGEEVFRAYLMEQMGVTSRQLDAMLAVEATPERQAALQAAWDSSEELAERTAPYAGLLRDDLRGDPAVFPAHSVLFTQVGERRRTGTHYTPRSLAEKVVRHTLAPLVYAPGPAEGADEADWKVRPAGELLALKVCDPAMGSGAFLVAAVRYLAERVVEAWQRDGLPEEASRVLGPGCDRDEVLLYAKRKVAGSCIYGVDRDDMAVSLAKLSLWLETLAKNKPFSFLDHALRCGDSLVGLVREEQVRAFHTDPVQGRIINLRVGSDAEEAITAALRDIAGLRTRIEELPPANDPEDVRHRAELLKKADARAERLRLVCDAVVAAALAAERYAELDLEEHEKKLQDGAAKKVNWQEAYNRLLLRLVDEIPSLLDEESYDFLKENDLESRVRDWLTGVRDEPIRPFHWALEFPEVMGGRGFDAVVGNPPFIGGQRLTGTIGADVREYLVVDIAGGKRGSADLCSYFLLRNLALAPEGRTGIIATNTIAQGDTREVGLDQVVDGGWTVYRAEKSRKWPGSANVHVSLVWAGHAGEQEKPVLDGGRVNGITPSLDPRSRVTGNPYRLVANEDQSFIGSYVLGEGFVLTPEQAQELIEADPKNKDVLFPYLNGKDLNSRPDCSPSRWVINFGAMSEEEAREYSGPFEIVERLVKPFRMKNNRKVYRDYWWQYGEKRPYLQGAIFDLDRVLVIALVSKTVMPVFSPACHVFAHKLAVFAVSNYSSLGVLSSSFHYHWAWTRSSTMKDDLNYSPSDVYETFPWPRMVDRISGLSGELDEFRRSVMLDRRLGLTKLYSQIHDSAHVGDAELDRLREIHVEIDEAVKDAYGWDDLDLEHGHHETPQGVRWTVSPQARTEILDRLLELNHARHQEEVEKGIWSPKKKRRKRVKAAPLPTEASPSVEDGGLFVPDGALF
ncbi:Eco57I restriction-modification methylase domain-containing protein [Nocardiopsis potens]|uniref:Eco57I restriction-modification methylase domain-containing protein n=1 Tax=Nocardiopsis potens TaxID=1246458 RepID=UPI00034541A3|nr:DNA methyltransferase [Nocardiopsis potens]